MILDHIDNLELPDQLVRKHHNDLVQLRVLAEGLHYLNSMVTGIVEGARVAWAKNPNALPRNVAPQALIRCAFDWYAVSACNFIRLVGWLAHEADNTCPEPHEYVKKVIPAVLTYRNKVAAHFAKASPGRDGAATLVASTLPSLSWINGIPTVGAFRVTIRRQGHLTQSEDWQWSLMQTHRELLPRYWPEQAQQKVT